MSNRNHGRGMFHKDLKHMMYGFGDAANPYRKHNQNNIIHLIVALHPLPETVALVEDILVEYITDMVHKAQDVATNRGNVSAEDVLFLIRKDLPKFNRCTELLSMQKVVKEALKVVDVKKGFNDEKLASSD